MLERSRIESLGFIIFITHGCLPQTDAQKILNMPASIVSDVEVQVAEPDAAPAVTVKEISSHADSTTATASLTTFCTSANEPTTSPVLIENYKSIIGTDIRDAEELIMTGPVESLITEIQPVANKSLEEVQASETAPLLGKILK